MKVNLEERPLCDAHLVKILVSVGEFTLLKDSKKDILIRILIIEQRSLEYNTWKWLSNYGCTGEI